MEAALLYEGGPPPPPSTVVPGAPSCMREDHSTSLSNSAPLGWMPGTLAKLSGFLALSGGKFLGEAAK